STLCRPTYWFQKHFYEALGNHKGMPLANDNLLSNT
ncbi:MAG: hypothetical protein ACI920_001105, partial [Saprospiraceae bacterium]